MSGDGTVEQVAEDNRDAPLTVNGTTLDGAPWTSEQERGRVVVLNVWGSWCPPCVAEAPELQRVHEQMQDAGQPVTFMGLNVKESSASARAFVRARGLTFPSLQAGGGRPILDLQGRAPTIPATVVLDAEGRMASRVLGPLTATILTGLIEDALPSGSR